MVPNAVRLFERGALIATTASVVWVKWSLKNCHRANCMVKCIYQIARRIRKEEQSKHTGWKETSYVLTGPK